MDGSFHAWLETRGPVDCLLTMIDDATGQTFGQFTGEETTWGAAEVLDQWIAQYGVPQALYVDAKTVFVRPAIVNELAAGIARVTQFGRMCAKLGIRLIVANSPEANGRVERVRGTNQDRLVKQLRRRGITSYATANQFLCDEYFPAHNARFAVVAAEPADFHLPLPPRFNRAHVFCLEERPLLTSRAVLPSSGSRHPFRCKARSPQERFIDCPCTSAGSTLPDFWSRELRGQMPAHPGRPRLISGFYSSPHRSHYPLLSAILSRSSPCGSLGSLRPTSQRTFTSESIIMLGTRLRRLASLAFF